MFVTVKFYGNLKRFGSEFRLDVQDTAEALRALICQKAGLRQALQRGTYKVRLGKHYFTMDSLEKDMIHHLKDGETIHVTPILQGAKSGGVFQAILGVALIATAIWAPLGLIGGMAGSNMIGMIGASLLLGGVAQMLTNTPSASGVSEESEKKQSTSFSNLGNLVAQGRPVPLAYGQILTGSMIISQGVETYNINV